MAVVGKVATEFKELDDARESLHRELARAVVSDQHGEYLMQRIERFVAAMIATNANRKF